MKKILAITQHEFVAVVTRREYLLALLVLPGVLSVVVLLLHSKTATKTPPVNTGVVGVVDQTGKLAIGSLSSIQSAQAQTPSLKELPRTEEVTIKEYGSLEAGLTELREARLDILYVIGSEYLLSGKMDLYARQDRHLRDNPPTGFYTVDNLMRANLLQELLPADGYQRVSATEAGRRVLNQPALNKLTVGDDGALNPLGNNWQRISAVVIPLSIVFLLGLSIFLSASNLLQATVEENQNRVIEIILSSVRPEQLVWGKILGLGAAGLVQVFLYLLLISQASIYLWDEFKITPALLGGFFVYWMLGFLLYAGLLIITGIVVGGRGDTNQFVIFWLATALLPVLLSESLLEAPNGLVARLLSFIPLTSPMTMAFRFGKTTVPALDVALSLVILVTSIYFVARFAGKILRTGSLMRGKRFTLPEVLRWARES
jgi:ABC-type Na+ efflux pump permease subunit